MSDTETVAQAPKPKRVRKPKPSITWPVRALVFFPGQKAARLIEGTRVIRESSRYIFIAPDQMRPYIQKTVIVYDAPGLVIELEQMAAPQEYQPPVEVSEPVPQQAPQVGPRDVLRLQGQQPAPGPLRARVVSGAPPISEAHDEAGNRIVLNAAFGMPIA